MRIMMIVSLLICIPLFSSASQEESANSAPEASVEQEQAVSTDTNSDAQQEAAVDVSTNVAQESENSTDEVKTDENESVAQQDEQPQESAAQEVGIIEIPAIPEPTIDEEVAAPVSFENEEPVGIDTVSLEDGQGNWLFKRIWWERAEERYGKIRELVNTIWESRTKFFVQRNELDRNVLDPFYVSIGMGQGELQVILAELEDFFKKEREKQGDLNEKERALFDTLTEEQESLRQLKMDVESITNLDHAIDDALGMLMDQINKARQLERQAWENFKEIAHVLSDIKAREVYYMMDGAGRNIKNISIYLDKDFANHFSRLVAEAKKHVARVLNQIQSLKEKGVDFKRQVDRLAQQEEQEKQEREAQEEEEKEAAKVKVKPKQGWLDWILSLPGIMLNNIIALVRMPYDLIFGGKK